LEQDVAAPTRLKPTLQVNEQLLPEASEVGQVPRVPFAGAGTAHELCAFTEIGMLSRAAASHQMILDFIAAVASDDLSFFITVPFPVQLVLL
jgi:hypothetical protein